MRLLRILDFKFDFGFDFQASFIHSSDMQFEPRKAEILPPVEIPLQSLSASALSGVILNYVEREGTDYGAVEVSLSTKINQIKKQLQNGEAKIIFDPNSETVTLMTALQWQKVQHAL